MRTGNDVNQGVAFLMLMLTAIANGQFYGRSLPCPTSYLDPDGDCVAGIAGKDYPLHSTFPETRFKCSDHPVKILGYFADPTSSCQVFHVCLYDGRQESFLCPNGTLFNQQFLVCDWWFNVNCNEADRFYQINEYLQAPINFHQGPIHPNGNPIPADSNLTPIDKSDNFDLDGSAVDSISSNNNIIISPHSISNSGVDQTAALTAQALDSNGVKGSVVESIPIHSQFQDYGVMPRRYVNTPEIKLPTATTETPATPSSIEWAMFGLKERKNGFVNVPKVRNSSFLIGLPRML